MNLSENIKKIRKDNNLSQEQLAEKLNVSRQSVSKWESGTAYPEMDKVLQLCQLFHLNIDDLLNQNISEVNAVKQSKNTVNKYIDDFLDFITKTIDMFASMKLKSKLKCIMEQFVIAIVLLIAFLILGGIFVNVVRSLLSTLPFYSILYDILESVYILFSLFLGVALLLHIFKVRYLDYYVIVKEETSDNLEEKVDPVSEKTEVEMEEKEQRKKKIYLEKKQEKIIIRDPKHAGYRIISGLLRCILFILKVIVAFIGEFFCFSLIGFTVCLVLTFLFIKTGWLFIGAFLGILAAIIVNLIVLDFIYCFLMNKKPKTSWLAITFVASLIGFGMGIAFFLIGFTKFNYVSNEEAIQKEDFIHTTETIPMSDDILIRTENMDWVEFIESDNNDVKLEFTHSKHYTPKVWAYKENEYFLIYNSVDDFKMIRAYIDDINQMKYYDYGYMTLTITTSKENIDKIKENQRITINLY